MNESELLLVILFSLIGSFVKSITGMGYGLVAIPLLTLSIDLETAVVVIAIPNLLVNAVLNHGVREERPHIPNFSRLALPAVAGTVVGTLLLVNIPETPLLLLLIATIVIFVANRLLTPDWVLTARQSQIGAPYAGMTTGLLQGSIGVAGPVVVMWFHSHRLPTPRFVASITAVFLLVTTSQAVVLIATGTFTRDRLLAGICALIASLVVIPLGTSLRSRLSGPRFNHLVLILLICGALSLTYRVIT